MHTHQQTYTVYMAKVTCILLQPYFARYKEDLDEYQQRCSQYWAGQTAETFEQYKRDLLKYHRKRRQYLTVMREKRAGTYVSKLRGYCCLHYTHVLSGIL